MNRVFAAWLGLALTGCVHAGPGRLDPLDALDPAGESEATIQRELEACARGQVERCETIGLQLLALGQRHEAYAALDRACAAKRPASCTGLVDLLLAKQAWIWDCAFRPHNLPEPLELRLRVHGAGPRNPARLELGLQPNRYWRFRNARTIRCLSDALEHTRLPPTMLDGVVVLDYRQSTDNDLAHARRQFSDPWRHTSVSVEVVNAPYPIRACSDRASDRCEVVMFEALHAVELPAPNERDLLELARAEERKHWRYFQSFCVDVEGRPFEVGFDSTRFDLINDVIDEGLAGARFEPVLIDGVAREVCTSRIVDVDYWWTATRPPR